MPYVGQLKKWSDIKYPADGLPGGVVLEVNGEPYVSVLRRGLSWLSPGAPNAYLIEAPDGTLTRVDLAPGSRIAGPAVIVEDETTTIVLSGYVARIDSLGYIVMTKEEA